MVNDVLHPDCNIHGPLLHHPIFHFQFEGQIIHFPAFMTRSCMRIHQGLLLQLTDCKLPFTKQRWIRQSTFSAKFVYIFWFGICLSDHSYYLFNCVVEIVSFSLTLFFTTTMLVDNLLLPLLTLLMMSHAGVEIRTGTAKKFYFLTLGVL
jgi:hypothetical protein